MIKCKRKLILIWLEKVLAITVLMIDLFKMISIGPIKELRKIVQENEMK